MIKKPKYLSDLKSILAITFCFKLPYNSSEIRGLGSTFCPREMLQNLQCLCKKKSQVAFFIFHFEQLWVLPYECPDVCQDRPGHS